MEGYGLSPQQKRLWKLQQEGGAAPYRAQSAIRIHGALDRERLAQALQKLVDRHEILRTSFGCPADTVIPLQIIASEGCAVALREQDQPTDQPLEGALDQLHERLRQAPRDLTDQPPWQAALARLDEDEHLLVWNLPALCADQRTLELLTLELAEAYRGTTDEDAIQYADLAEWQNEILLSPETRGGKSFWQRQSLASLAQCELPFERPVPAADPGFAPRFLALAAEDVTAREIAATATELEVAEESLLLACWAVVLARWCGRHEVTVGVALDGRDYEELQGAIGLFARYLPLASRLEPRLSFAELVGRVETHGQQLVQWQQHFSWQDALADSGSEARSDYLPFAFEYLQRPRQLPGGEVSFSPIRHDARIDRFVVQLRCERWPAENDRLDFELHYDTNRCTSSDIAMLGGSFLALVRAAVERPGAALCDLQWLSEIERQRLYTPRDTVRQVSDAELVHRQFETSAARWPDQLAVVCEGERATYSELDRRSNRWARHLRSLGVGPETLVGLRLERSVEMVVAILGVLRAGGGYVPIDPQLPAERLEYLLADSGVKVLITRRELYEAAYGGPWTTLLFEESAAAVQSQSPARLEELASPQNVAYVIYTSGSTGRPKGVAVEHRQLASYTRAIRERLQLEPGWRLAMVSTFAADLGHTCTFPALAGGGSLHVISAERATDSVALGRYFSEHQIDVLKIVPSHLEALLNAPAETPPLPRHWLVMGGEACPWQLVARVRELAPECRLLNHYGPTETTVGALAHEVMKRGPEPAPATAPIGRALSNSRVYLLDDRGQPVPAWISAQAHIGGAGVTRGYLGQPRRTSEAFVPDPISSVPGARLYRTGDLTRWLTDGEVEFLGRVDDQIKIRGFRVEPGEIAAVLRGHPEVGAAAVVAREDVAREAMDGKRRLVGYVVPEHEAAAIEPVQLRAWLSRSLPAYMIPAAFVTLEELPLNANGKLDRGALPDPVDVADDLGSAPRTPMEELVVGIWIDLLGRQAIGLDENFFDLGGHSLLAMQVRARLREACEVELSLPTLFEAPTVAGLAKALERGRRGAHEEEPSIERVPRDRDLPTSFAQERLWVLHQMEPDSPAYHIFVAVELRGRLDISALASSFSEICRRHESLRTAFATLQGQAVQQITPPRPWIGSLVELTGLGSKTVDALVRRLAIDESRRPFDLSRGELMRCLLLRRGASEHVILLTLHHIVSDGWSMAILLREMMVLYEAFSRGLPSPLHALPIQYADFAVWQRQWLDDARMKQEMDYWRGQLAGVPELLELPTDRPRPQVQSDRGGLVTSSLPGELAADLQALCRREGVTLFMALTAGFNALLYALTGREDLVVGTDVAGRERAELEGLIGFFVNQLVLRTDLSGEPTLREVLHRVRRVALDAYAHQNLPFEKLVAAVNPRRSLSYAPLFQVKLILQHASASEPPQGSELTMRRLRLRAATSQIDLLINVTAAAEGLWLSAEYSADLFEAATVERWLARFATVLSWLATRSEATLAELRQQLMQEDRQDKQTTENALAAASQDKLRKLKRRPRMLSAG